jgi:hypothetical protein
MIPDFESVRESVMLAQRLQNPRDWYGAKVQFPVGQSIMILLLFGLEV